MSPQSPSNSSISTDTDQAGTAGKNPAAAFGANEWLVDEIYQQYLQDPNSVDRAWWDFFADYKPGAAATPTAAGTVPTDAGSTPPAGKSPGAGREILTDEDRRVERILLELRLREGVPLSLLREAGLAASRRALSEGLLQEGPYEAGSAVLTLRGRLLADAVVRDLVD